MPYHDPHYVVATYEFPTVKRYLDHTGAAYTIDRDLSPSWGSDLGTTDHYVLRFELVEDAAAFRQAHPHVLLDESLYTGPRLIETAFDVANDPPKPGSHVETLPGMEPFSMDDLRYFDNRLRRGLDVPANQSHEPQISRA